MTVNITMQPISLWPVWFYDFQWEDHDQHTQSLRQICYDLEREKNFSDIAVNAKGGLYESAFDFLAHEHSSVQALRAWITTCFLSAARHANQMVWKPGRQVQVNLHESWCHITRDGGFHDMHAHPDSSWSSIYYLDVGDMRGGTTNGVNRFYNPNHNMYVDAGTAWMQNQTSTDFFAEPGMLIIFPSWVQHSAITYRGQRDRLVVAANCRIVDAPCND